MVTWWAGKCGLRTSTVGNGPWPVPLERCLIARSVRTVPAPVLTYRHAFRFDLAPDRLWEQIEVVDQFERWWPWLTEFRIEGPGLSPGSVLHGMVSPPLPYRMRLHVELGECTRPEAIDATISGDLVGDAGLRLRPEEGGTRAEAAGRSRCASRPCGWPAGSAVRSSSGGMTGWSR